MAKANDIVLIYLEDQPIVFARIENISPDVKKDWYQVKLLMLKVPLQVTTWILRENYINGQAFTMGGKSVRMETVVCPKEPDPPGIKKEPPEKPSGQKVISITDLKKKSSPKL
jgi:hypothetical protein